MILEQLGDRGELEPETAQSKDLVEPANIGVVVTSMPRSRAISRPEQPYPVVMVERSHRDTRGARELANGPNTSGGDGLWGSWIGHADHHTP